ncbi:hypothetical protein V8D89_009472 [Ganoderma adspersum]
MDDAALEATKAGLKENATFKQWNVDTKRLRESSTLKDDAARQAQELVVLQDTIPSEQCQNTTEKVALDDRLNSLVDRRVEAPAGLGSWLPSSSWCCSLSADTPSDETCATIDEKLCANVRVTALKATPTFDHIWKKREAQLGDDSIRTLQYRADLVQSRLRQSSVYSEDAVIAERESAGAQHQTSHHSLRTHDEAVSVTEKAAVAMRQTFTARMSTWGHRD